MINATNNPYPESPDASPTKLDKGGYDGNAETLDNKIDDVLAEAALLINNTLVGSASVGSIVPSSVPPATGAVHAFATQAGTYTNWGGYVLPANTIAIISRSAGLAFSISQTPLDVTGKVNVSDVVNNLTSTETTKPLSANQGRVLDLKIAQGIVNWTAKAFLINDEVSHLGKIWRANAAIVTGDVPGTSSKWTEILSFYGEKIINLEDYCLNTIQYFYVWVQYGFFSNGFLNTDSNQSHFEEYIEVGDGDIITSDLDMYRICLYTSAKVYISQGGFLGGKSFTIPKNLGVKFIRISSLLSSTANATKIYKSYSVKSQVINIDSRVTANEINIASKQSLIEPNASILNFNSYIVNGAINTDGTLNSYTFYRSISMFPIDPQLKYILLNTVDILSNKKAILYKSNGTISRVIIGVNMEKHLFTPLADETFISITLVSGNAPSGSEIRLGEIKLYSTTNTGLYVDKINGFELSTASSVGLQTHLNAFNPHNITASMIGAVTNILIGTSSLSKDGESIVLPNATPSQAGIMSASDKQKIDGLSPTTVNISGSGIAKNASAYGFLPTKTALENAVALQNALNNGGTILVDYKGTYDLCNTIYLDSDTTLIFGAGVYINKKNNASGNSAAYTFINRGAFSREYNQNISILGLNLISNGLEMGADVTRINGLRGQIAFFYIKNLIIDGFTLLDGGSASYVIHVCTFENAQFINTHIEGYKDGIHLGRGSKFVIRHGIFKTYDDPIALNAHDYASGNPELGWIENGLIEDCYDLSDETRGTTGYFCRILAGAWVKWFYAMEIKQGDTIVASNGNMYRANNSPDGFIYTSLTEPIHLSGTVIIDGINWVMYQNNNVVYNCGVRNVHFKDIFLQKPRPTAFSIHFDKDNYSRSYYPNASSPVQEDLIFENIYMQADIANLISCVTPINVIKLINSNLKNSKISLANIGTDGIVYNKTHILMLGTTFKGFGSQIIASATSRTANIKTLGSIVESETFIPSFSGVTILSSDVI